MSEIKIHVSRQDRRRVAAFVNAFYSDTPVRPRVRLPILAGLWIAASATALLWAVFFAALRLF